VRPLGEMSHDLDDLSTHRFRAELRVRMLAGGGLGGQHTASQR